MARSDPTLQALRRHALARSLFAPTTLPLALQRLAFVQADPLRAPARAQDLTLRHRVAGYVAGDLERRYAELGIEEDFFVNYGFLGARHHALMHPRVARVRWGPARQARADAVLAFVRERGAVHPREVDARFDHGKVTNWFGGSSNASTELLDGLHYRGLLRVARRDAGTRVYAARAPWAVPADKAECRARMDALVDVIVAAYAPLPAPTLGQLVHRLRAAAPQWAGDRARALAHAKQRLAHARVDGLDWYWPAGEDPAAAPAPADDRVWLLAPFDPLVWDRLRFERFWGWPYRFEAYTPAAKRTMGHYALPLLWREQVVGWANVAVDAGAMRVEVGFAGPSRRGDAAFARAMDDELHRLHRFLGLPPFAHLREAEATG
ncbi:MAG: winged helix-turn-helix domain-containing protein [Ideonella sp.]|nr:winged helix-turn-helix domain-containing protein [Ideonella sp.]MCC7459616.1 YcaQ family DNA glycosylase [Nitrospira sp.]